MKKQIQLFALTLLLAARLSGSYDEIEDLVFKSDMIILGRPIQIEDRTLDGELADTVGIMQVEQYLKGIEQSRAIRCTFRFGTFLEIEPEEEDAIWFLGPKQNDGSHLVTEWQWSDESLHDVLKARGLLEKDGAFTGIPSPKNAISMSIGLLGKDSKSLPVISISDSRYLTVLIQFQNKKKTPFAFLAPLDGSTSKRRFPHYSIELKKDGRPYLTPTPSSWCGNINQFSEKDFSVISNGEVFGTFIRTFFFDLPEGEYSLRVVYENERDLSLSGITSSAPSEHVRSLMSKAWVGKIRSNHVKIIVNKNDANKAVDTTSVSAPR